MKGKVSFYLLLICSLVCISILVFNLSDDFMIIKAIVFMRTLCIPGLLFVNYLDFFLTHDLTYYTHVSIIQLFTGAYPYNEPLGYVIGDIYGGETLMLILDYRWYCCNVIAWNIIY